MKKIIIIIIFLILVISGCSSEEVTTKTTIMTTVDPVYDMATKIGGDKVEVKSVYPMGVDIHNYELTSKEMQAVVDSDIFFYISYTSDHFVKDLENSGTYETKFINITEHPLFKNNVDPSLYDENGIIDPHVWVSPKMDMLIANVIVNELCAFNQENCDYYTNNYNVVIEELKEVDQMYKDFANTQDHVIITTHESFNYLTLDYGIEVKSVYGISHESEPTSKDIQGYIDYINQNEIKYIYSDSNDMENKVMLQIKENTGCEILPIYNLEAVDDQYFVDQLKVNIESMAK